MDGPGLKLPCSSEGQARARGEADSFAALRNDNQRGKGRSNGKGNSNGKGKDKGKDKSKGNGNSNSNSNSKDNSKDNSRFLRFAAE